MGFLKPCFPNGIKQFPFTQQQIVDIWSAAKNLRDGGLRPDQVIRELSDQTGIDQYHISQALDSPKTIPRNISNAAWAKAGAYRRIVSEAKVRIAHQQQSPAIAALNKLYELPRAAKTVGHWAVYTGTHGGDFLWMPSEYGRFLDQWQRGWRAVSKDYFDKAVDNHLRNTPLHDLYTAAGLDNDPYGKATGIYAEKSYIPDKFRAGPRGYGTLGMARDRLMDNLWERVKRIDPNAGKDQMKLVASTVNHVWGSVKLPAKLSPYLGKFIFATKLLPARLMSTFVDIPKAAGTFLNWKNANAAQRVTALFQARRVAQVLVLHHAIVAANAAWNAATGGPQVNTTNPSQVGDFMAFKIGGLTFRPPSAILEAERLTAGFAYALLAGGNKTAGDVLQDYASGKLNPAIHLANEVATGVNWLGEKTPFKGLKERITGEPPMDNWGPIHKPITKEETAGAYALERSLPIPAGGSSREIYEIFKQEGLNSSEASAWMRALSNPRVWAVGASEAQGITAHQDIPYKQKPPNKLATFLQQKAPYLGQ